MLPDTDARLAARFRFDGIGGAVLFVLAVGVCAHLVLDRVANLVLDHDPFDDLGHPSRISAVLVVASFVAFGIVHALYRALVEASQRSGTIARERPRERPFSLVAGAAFAGGCVVVPALEAFDTIGAARPLANVDALFAGSVWLALAVTAVVALLATVVLRATVRSIAGLRATLVAALAVLFFSASDRYRRASERHARRHRCVTTSRTFWIRAAKRGPPVLQRA